MKLFEDKYFVFNSHHIQRSKDDNMEEIGISVDNELFCQEVVFCLLLNLKMIKFYIYNDDNLFEFYY
jgi:hypothetical protein